MFTLFQKYYKIMLALFQKYGGVKYREFELTQTAGMGI